MKPSRPHPPFPSPVSRSAAPEADFWLERYSDERSIGDRLRMRLCVAAAALVHVVLFAVTFPAVSESEPEPEPRVVVFEMPTFVVKPPEPDPVVREAPPPRTPEVVIPVPLIEEPVPVERPPVVPPPPLVFETPPVTAEVPAPPPAPDDRPLRFGSGMTKPVKVFGPAPAYTEAARRARQTGIVVLEAVIDERGEVTELTVLKGLPFGLTESALRAVGQWRFDPSRLNGRPVAVLYNLTVRFELN